MIETVKDKQGKVIAYAVYSLRNKFGLEDGNGVFVWVDEVWIHKKYRKKFGVLKRLTEQAYLTVPTAKHMYFQRGVRNKHVRQYTKEEIEKHVLGL